MFKINSLTPFFVYLILRVPLSLMGPSILLSIFLSYEFVIFSIFFVMAHVLLSYINTGRITVLYNCITEHVTFAEVSLKIERNYMCHLL
jgi:hypothetical protein